MSGMTDKIKGNANEAVGNAKQTIGRLVGSDKLEAEGLAQQSKGTAQKAVGEVKEGVKSTANKAADAVNRNL
jgi:uncharacterized protein YjbJ (UPF0337 family)